MKKMILILFVIFGKYGAAADKPYEATWLEIDETDSVVYKYPILDDEERTVPVIIRIKGDSLIFSDYNEIAFFRLNNIELLNKNSYSMLSMGEQCNTLIRFDYVNKDKHIAKWTLSNCDGSIITENIYVDSLYNTFPIVNYDELKQLGKQFDSLYAIMPLLSLPVKYSGLLVDSIAFIEIPRSLYSTLFDFYMDYIDLTYVAKLPEYNNIMIIIVKFSTQLQAFQAYKRGLYLYTFLNNRLIDKLYVEGVHDKGVVKSLTSFSITNNYEISVQNSFSKDKKLNSKRQVYILRKDGKFIKK